MRSFDNGKEAMGMGSIDNPGYSRSVPQKRNWESIRGSTWNGFDFKERIIDGTSGSSEEKSPRTGFLDHAGSIGEAISKAIATSKREAQRVTPSSPGEEWETQYGRYGKEEFEGDERLSKHEKILRSLNNHAVRKYLAEKATLRWYEMISHFNHIAKQMGGYLFWQKNLRTLLCKNANFRIFEKWDGEFRSFDLCFPMVCTVWEALERCGQTSIEFKPSRLRAQVLSNGSIILEDSECSYTGYWRDGSSLNRKVCMTISLNLDFMIQWLEIKFIDTKPKANWYALEKMLQTSISNTHMMDKLNRMIKLSQMLGEISQSNSLSSDNSIKELHAHVRAFSDLSDAGRHQRARKTFQMADVMTGLSDLLAYRKEKQISSPLEALQNYVVDYQNSKSRYIAGIVSPNEIPRVDGTLDNANTLSKLCSENNQNSSSPMFLQRKNKQIKKGKKITKKLTSASSISPNSSASPSSSSPANSRTLKDDTSKINAIPGTKRIKF